MSLFISPTVYLINTYPSLGFTQAICIKWVHQTIDLSQVSLTENN